jgi:hypothetical protein
VAIQRARRSADAEVEEERREEPAREEPPALQLQRAAGNQAVARVLARRRTVARFGGDPNFQFGGLTAESPTITDQEECDEAVEELMEERYGGVRALFMQNTVATSVGSWATLVYSFMEENYTLEGIDRGNVVASIKAVKAKHRPDTLQHLARTWVYWSSDGPPWSLDNLKDRLTDAGAYLDADDAESLEAIYNSDAEFAVLKVDFDRAKNIELLDEDNVVVILDHHQQKHQTTQIPLFGTYQGARGSKFASGKDEDWHRDNTAQVVKETVEEAVKSGAMTPDTDSLSPSKDAKDGIIYDLTITYDKPTGKYVGSYHCNPVVHEGD